MTTNSDLAIAVRGLRKSFDGSIVLDGVDLTVRAGTVFALLGPNGSGKTTTVRILATLIPADGGSASIAGHDVGTDPNGVRSVIGMTGQFSAVDKLLTATENLMLMADLRHLGRAEARRKVGELLERFDLTGAADKPVATFSGGMTRRLDLAMTLVGTPRIIFLDEPTTGLDPRSRLTMWQIIGELVGDGVTIFLTTQYLDEADRLADRIALLDGGRIVAEGTPADLKRLIPGGHLTLRFGGQRQLVAAAGVLGDGRRDDDKLTLQVPTDGTVPAIRSVLDRLDDAAVDVAGMEVHETDLDDVFLALTGSAVRSPGPQFPPGRGPAATSGTR